MVLGANKLWQSLERTRNAFFGQITGLFGNTEINDELWDDLEALLIQADVGVATVHLLIKAAREAVTRQGLTRASDVKQILRQEMINLLRNSHTLNINHNRLLNVILVVGVNGSGKTTTIAKLAHRYREQGYRVTLAAADTFRAAAISQLQMWGERAGAIVIAHQPGADPGAVVFDAIKSCQARGASLLIVDTAGRLHTKYNLMKELEKLRVIMARQVHEAPHETLLVLDATTGQNAISQAHHFKESVNVTGVVLAKLDGTAKGGVVFAIARELGLPVRFVGIGERLSDLEEFDAESFVDGLFGK
ncbi:MAG: signal recognition particle-docking protein FtsY [Anaerolineae bacterium]